MRILLTNDDGIHAPGLEVLEQIAAQFTDDVWICAPAEEQSGAGHSLTLNRPVRLQKFSERRFAVTGTPTDAVSIGLREVLGPDMQPDLILSGVNRGANLGDDITYSGTASAAMEGALAGIRSIALSQVISPETRGTDAEFKEALDWAGKVIKPLIEAPFGNRTFLNANFPPVGSRGIRITRQGFHDYSRGSVVEGTDPRGLKYFWFGLHPIEHTLDHGTDLEAIADGYVTVTPLQLDLTHYPAIDILAGRFEE